jgi:hypothetical protein
MNRNIELQVDWDKIMMPFMFEAQNRGKCHCELTFDCGTLLAELYYEKLGRSHMAIFGELTEFVMNTKGVENGIKMAAITFWHTLIDVEETMLNMAQECNMYVNGAMSGLVPLLLHTLSPTHLDDFFGNAYELRMAGALCLKAWIRSQTIGSDVVRIVKRFAQQQVICDDWRTRAAAIVAFSCILSGLSSPDDIGQIVNNNIPYLLAAINHSSLVVKDDALRCISFMCKLHMAAIPCYLVSAIMQGLTAEMKNASPRLAGRACRTISTMIKALKNSEGASASDGHSLLMMPLMEALLNTLDRSDAMEVEGKVAENAMCVASKLIQLSAFDAQLAIEFLPKIVGRIELILKDKDCESKQPLLVLLSGLVTASFQRLENRDVLPYADRVVQVVKYVLRVRNDECCKQAIALVGAVAHSFGNNFTV